MTKSSLASEFPPRESMQFDVVIVGAGPSGLSAAIHLKTKNPELSIVIIEKASSVGGHILSGAVFDKKALETLIPDFQNDKTCPLRTKVTSEKLYLFTKKKAFSLPTFFIPKFLKNDENYIISLSELCRWLGKKAEALGIEIYPGFAATEFLTDDKGAVKGVATGDMGLLKDGSAGPNFTRGMELLGTYTLIAEGARGSLAKKLIAHFRLAKHKNPQKYGLGLKEIWEIPEKYHKKGTIMHSLGWPLKDSESGGGFVYHSDQRQIFIGFVVHLDYKNPFLSPFQEFQKFKTHPKISALLKNGKRLAYGARTLSEGGFQSIPEISFPGGALLGCSAGYMNLAKLKGCHNAIYSGIAAAEEIFIALKEAKEKACEPIKILPLYQNLYQKKINSDLYLVRNIKPLWARFGTKIGLAFAYLDLWIQNFLNVSILGTLKHKKPDYLTLELAKNHKKPNYPKADQTITFDIANSLMLANVYHEEKERCHLQISSLALQNNVERALFGGPSQYYCPAFVYEWVKEQNQYRYMIQAQNCLHCKCCDIKDPNQNITWTPPQGGGGPSYSNM